MFPDTIHTVLPTFLLHVPTASVIALLSFGAGGEGIAGVRKFCEAQCCEQEARPHVSNRTGMPRSLFLYEKPLDESISCPWLAKERTAGQEKGRREQ